MAALAPIREHIVELDLTETRISDRASSSLASMHSLVRLQLDRTAVTGGMIRELADLPELRVLHLVGCEQVTDDDVSFTSRPQR